MQLKLVNLNVWLGGKLMPQILEFLSVEKPDILTLQEAYNETDESLPQHLRTVSVIKKHLGLNYDHFEPSFYEVLESRKIDRGNAIISRFPIIKKDGFFIFGEYGKVVDVKELFHSHPRNMQHSQIEANGIILNVYNLQGIYGPHGQDTPERIELGRKVAEEIKDEKNVILTGDFNMQPDIKAIEQITKHLDSVFGTKLKTTFNMKRKEDPGYATAAVDMVFVSKEVKILKKEIHEADVSDHLPLVVTIEI